MNVHEKKFIKKTIGPIVFILSIIAISSFSDDYIYLELDSDSVFYVESSWWGLSKKTRIIKWMKPEGYDYHAWCTRSESGKWYPFLVEPPLEREYQY